MSKELNSPDKIKREGEEDDDLSLTEEENL